MGTARSKWIPKPRALALFLVLAALASPRALADDAPACPAGSTRASGEPEDSLIARAASKGVRAVWCERYDAAGRTHREGAYRDFHPNGSVRAEGTYVASRLDGPVRVFHDNGAPFLVGTLDRGHWDGELRLFHPNGAPWIELHYRRSRLHGPARMQHPDGSPADSTTFQKGREDGLARSYYPKSAGGRLQSEVHVEADRIVGTHHLFDPGGQLVDTASGASAPPDWAREPQNPRTPASAAPLAAGAR